MAAKEMMLPARRAFNSNGAPVGGAVAKLYVTGTSTPSEFFADTALTESLGHSITASGVGIFSRVYQDDAIPYRLVIETSEGDVLDDIDPFYFGVVAGYEEALAEVTALLDDKLDDSQAGAFGLDLLDSPDVAAAKASLAYVKGDIGLGNVDNTSDANKPISTATQTALDAKLDDSQAGAFGLDLLDSADVAAAKASLAYVKGDVGLGNVDNTSDANKPVSTATQTALDLKANLAGATFGGDISVPDEAYGAGWNASLEVPTKNAIYDKIETMGGGVSNGDYGDVSVSAGVWTVESAAGNFVVTGDATVNGGDITIAGTGEAKLHLSGYSGTSTGYLKVDNVGYAYLQGSTAIAFMAGGSQVGQADANGLASIAADVPYDATSWNGSNVLVKRNEIRDKIESMVTVTDGDKGDVVVSSTGTIWTVDSNAISFSKFVAAPSAGFVGATGAGNYSHRTPTEVTAALDVATTSLKGLLSSADKTKLDADIASVKYDAAGAALGAGIADYFTSSISLEASSTYELECHAYFLKTTAGTVTWTWAFSSAPTVVTSRSESTPATGFTTTTITGAPVQAQATVEAQTTCAHAASGSLTTAVRHSFIFWVRIRTNAATTVQLRCTESAGTVTPQPGSYMRARKII